MSYTMNFATKWSTKFPAVTDLETALT